MEIRRKKLIDYYLGGVVLTVLQPLVKLLGLILRRDHRIEPRGSIGILKLLGGGTLIIALPALLGIRRRYPRLKLVLICTSAVHSYAEILAVFDQIVIVDDRNLRSVLVTGVRALQIASSFDTIIDLEVYSRLSTLFTVLSCARNRIGFYLEFLRLRKNIYTHLIFFNRIQGNFNFYEQICWLLDGRPVSMLECREHIEKQLKISREGKKLEDAALVLAPFSSEHGRERMLNAPQWEMVFEKRREQLSKLKQVIILGGNADRQAAAALAEILKPIIAPKTLRDACGELPLAQSVALMARCSLFWGIDSGLLHWARLLGVPCLSFWGPTAPQSRLKPVPDLTEEVIYWPIYCSPCIHVAEIPPCGGNNLCIKQFFEPPDFARKETQLNTTWRPKSDE